MEPLVTLYIHLSVKIQLIHTNKYQNRSVSRNHKIIIFWSVFVLCAKILSFVDITHTIAIFTWFQVLIPRQITTLSIYVVPPEIQLFCPPHVTKPYLDSNMSRPLFLSPIGVFLFFFFFLLSQSLFLLCQPVVGQLVMSLDKHMEQVHRCLDLLFSIFISTHQQFQSCIG